MAERTLPRREAPKFRPTKVHEPAPHTARAVARAARPASVLRRDPQLGSAEVRDVVAGAGGAGAAAPSFADRQRGEVVLAEARRRRGGEERAIGRRPLVAADRRIAALLGDHAEAAPLGAG